MAAAAVGVQDSEEVMLTSRGNTVVPAEPKSRRTVRASEHLAVKHALPKTRLYHTILHENTSQERHLTMKLQRIQRRKGQFASNLELSRRTFINRQNKKHHKWRQEDEVRSGSMNFPVLRHDSIRTSNKHRPATVNDPKLQSDRRDADEMAFVVMYKSPRYFDDDNEKLGDGTLLPFMKLCKQSTEFIEHNKTTYMTRIPSFIEVDDKKLKRYNTYCGSVSKQQGEMVKDTRFLDLTEALSARKSAAKIKNPGKYVMRESLTADDRSSRQERASNAEKLVKSAGAVDKKSLTCRSRVIFPSLSKSVASSHPELKAPSTHDAHSPTRERTLNDLKIGKSGRKKSIQEDLKTKDLRDLVQSYGAIKSAYGGGHKDSAHDTEAKNIGDDARGGKKETNQGRAFKSPTLQLMFSVKSNFR